MGPSENKNRREVPADKHTNRVAKLGLLCFLALPILFFYGCTASLCGDHIDGDWFWIVAMLLLIGFISSMYYVDFMTHEDESDQENKR